jgi:glycosidase
MCSQYLSHYPKESADVLMNFLGTHDTARILTELGGAPAAERSNAELSVAKMTDQERSQGVARLKIAYQLVSVMPGLPCIFYGDEAGLEGYGDPFCRRPFPWGRENRDLTMFYQKVGRYHRDTPVFRDGYVRLLYISERSAAVLRYNGKDPSVLLLLNRSDSQVVYRLSESGTDAETGVQLSSVTLSPMSGRFLQMQTDTVTVKEFL